MSSSDSPLHWKCKILWWWNENYTKCWSSQWKSWGEMPFLWDHFNDLFLTIFWLKVLLKPIFFKLEVHSFFFQTLQVVTLQKFKWYDFILKLHKLYNGTHLSVKNVSSRRYKIFQRLHYTILLWSFIFFSSYITNIYPYYTSRSELRANSSYNPLCQ